jgi:hypothetical protein
MHAHRLPGAPGPLVAREEERDFLRWWSDGYDDEDFAGWQMEAASKYLKMLYTSWPEPPLSIGGTGLSAIIQAITGGLGKSGGSATPSAASIPNPGGLVVL